VFYGLGFLFAALLIFIPAIIWSRCFRAGALHPDRAGDLLVLVEKAESCRTAGRGLAGGRFLRDCANRRAAPAPVPLRGHPT
jgi:hypothetical protein